MKNATRIILFLLAALAFPGFVYGQMVGSDAYVKGSYVEIGLSGAGGFEGADMGVSPPLPGMHPRTGTSYMGFVANPQMDGWVNYDGDFFTPGTPENGWGFEIGTYGAPGTIIGASNCFSDFTYPNNINGSIVSWNHIGTTYLVTWEGDCTSGTNIHFQIDYQMEETDLFYQTTVTVTNNTTDTIPEFYYYRNVDPDNNQSISFDYTTQNTILSQHQLGMPASISQVTATQAAPWTSYLSLMGTDTSDWKASVGGFSNRDAWMCYNGTFVADTTTGHSSFADEAITLTQRILNLAPAVPMTFKFATVFDPSAVHCAIAAGKGSITSPAAVCAGSSPLALSAVPAGGSFSGTGVVGATFDPSVSGTGDFLIKYSYTDTSGCASTVIQKVRVVDSILFSPPSGICLNEDPFLLSALPAGATFSGTGVTGATFDPLLAGAGTYSLTCSLTGCPSSVQTVEVLPLPVVGFNPLSAVCENISTYSLSGGIPAGGVYTGVAVSGADTFYPSSAGAGTFPITYTFTASNGCHNSAIQSIQVNPLPSVTLSAFSNACAGFSDFILSGGSPAGGAYSGTNVTGVDTFDLSSAFPGVYTITYSYTDGNGCESSAAEPLNVMLCEGISEATADNSLIVYPNPFNDETTFSFSTSVQLRNAELQVFDLLGKEVREMKGIEGVSFKFSREGIVPGMYFYRIMDGSEKIGEGKLLIR